MEHKTCDVMFILASRAFSRDLGNVGFSVNSTTAEPCDCSWADLFSLNLFICKVEITLPKPIVPTSQASYESQMR